MRAIPAARARHPLSTRGLPALGVAAAALVMQQLAIRHFPVEDGWTVARQVSFVATTFIVLGLAIHMRRLIGAWLVALGIALNCLPMLAHGGTMPVAWETLAATGEFSQITEDMHGQHIPGSKNILLYRHEIRFEWLSDRYPLAPLRSSTNVYSLGDFVLFAGIAIALVELTLWVAGFERLLGYGRTVPRPALK